MELTFDLKEFVQKTKKIILKPKAFFKGVHKETEWKVAFSYSIAIAIISSVLGILQLFILYPVLSSALPTVFEPGRTPAFLDLLPAFFMSTVVVVALGFAWAWILHRWFWIIKMKGSYWDVYRAYTYSRAPLSILGWIPYLGGLFGLYGFYVLGVGISSYYKIPLKKALLLLLPPVAALFFVQTFLYIVAAGSTP